MKLREPPRIVRVRPYSHSFADNLTALIPKEMEDPTVLEAVTYAVKNPNCELRENEVACRIAEEMLFGRFWIRANGENGETAVYDHTRISQCLVKKRTKKGMEYYYAEFAVGRYHGPG